MALRAYNSPGIVVTESVNPALAPLLANPQIVAIVGAAKGEQSASERLILTVTAGTPDAITLAHTGVQTSSVVVKSSTTGETLNAGNFVITAGADPDTTVTGDEPYTIKLFSDTPAAPTATPNGTGLTGTYQYAVSFLNANGQTGIGAASTAQAVTNSGFNLSAIALGPTGTTGRNVYRRKTAGTGELNVWRLVATVNDNVTTTLSTENTPDATAQTAPTPPTTVSPGDTVVVSYDYTDQNYYEPTLMSDYGDVVDKYGAPFDANGLIDSELSFAARIAFLNGASELVLVAASADTDVAVEDALEQLIDEPSVRIVVAARGSSAVRSAVSSHVTTMISSGHYRIGVVGTDGSATVATAATQRSGAQGLNTEAIRMVNISSLAIQNPVTGRDLNVGGQYAAAAIAGMYAARDVQIPLTRKNIAGFAKINDKRTESEKALDSAAGLLVIEDRGGVLRVRHDITTAVGSVNTRESSVVRAKFEMAARLKDTLDGGVVGTVTSTTRAPQLVEAVVIGVLEGLMTEEAISTYGDVKARLLTGDPTTVEVRFQYTPAYPINNIQVVFTINTTTGDFTLGA